MKKAFRIIVPILLIIAVLFSIGWYLFQYDPAFTRDMLLNQARAAEKSGNHSLATWFYDVAYEQSGGDETVALELAERYVDMGNYTRAEYTLSKAIADGASSQLYYTLCKTYVQQDKLLDAVTMLDNIADPAIKAELDAMRPQAPIATPEPGYYNQYITITLTAPEGTIYTSASSEYPSTKSEPYRDSITLPGGETTIYALCVDDNYMVSPLSIFGYTVAGVIEKVTMTDPQMEQIVRQQLKVSDEHVLYSDELWSITALEISGEVKNLSDLSKMPFLKQLTIHSGDFENLKALSGLTNLESLVIEDTAVSTEDVATIAALPNLTSLTMNQCGIATISGLSSATGLKHLDLQNNTIRDLDSLRDLKNLEYLDLSHNAVTDLDALEALSALKELRASYNSIESTAPLRGCSLLSAVYLDHNKLTALDGLEQLAGLSCLIAENNQITDIRNLAVNTELTELDLSNNALADISALSSLSKLLQLDFSYNQVTQLPDFSKECALVTINGSHNQLTSLEYLKGLPQLNYVIMERNVGITSVAPLVKCYQLIEVNVYGTGVTDVSVLEKLNVIVHYSPLGAG